MPASGFPRSFGKYTLLSHLAVGGMADVFLAQQKGPAGFEKECVIKRILPNLALDQGFVNMFLDEARIAARLSHPNIAQIFDLGQVDGDYFLALEYINGITLERILDTVHQKGTRALPWPIAVRIVANIAEGLDHAHRATDSSGQPLMLVHRDVSPSNIVVSWDGVAKILDFGIAKAAAHAKSSKVKTEVGIIKGKVPYMSPEQLQGLELDGRADVFSLGAVLYEITCGQRPFLGDSMGQLTVQIMSRDPIDPTELNPSFPEDLQPILWRALAKTTDERYPSAREFKVALEQFLADQHVACTHYDVEAYLRELVPETQRPPHPAQAAQAALAATESGMPSPVQSSPALFAQMPLVGVSSTFRSDGRPSSRPPRDTSMTNSGSSLLTTADKSADSGSQLPALRGAHTDLDLDAEEQRKKAKGGGSGVVMAAIFGLVVLTAIVFYILHARAVDRSADKNELNKPENTGVVPAPSTGAAAPATPAAATPAVTPPPAVPATADKTKPAEKPADKSADKAEKPAEKPADKAAEKPAADKPADKPRKPRPVHKAEEDDGAPRALPRLPTPPPAEPE